MKLRIENLAKIKHAEFNIDGITVIAGENNTGKSTIGKVLYSIFTSFHDLEKKVLREKKKSLFNILVQGTNRITHNIFDYNKVINELLNSKNTANTSLKNILQLGILEMDVTDDIVEKIQETLAFSDRELTNLIVNEIFMIEFNNQLLPIIKKEGETSIEIEIKEQNIVIQFEHEGCKILKRMNLDNDGYLIDNPFIIDSIDNVSKNQGDDFLDVIMMNGSIDYQHEHKLKKVLSKSITSENKSLINEALNKKRMRQFLDIIQDTICGDIVEKDNRFLFFDRSHGKNFELANLSTGIKSFAIILKLLENNDIGDKSMLILDEPEVHLHPKWQLIYAELLVLLQKEFDLNIILTTHSPYFVNALEVYSRKHHISQRCNYYLSEIREDHATFMEVTNNPEKIYEKLADPFKELIMEEELLNE